MGSMNKLLNKTLKAFAIYSLIVFSISIPFYYYTVDKIWLNELDEHNRIIADRTAQEMNNIHLSQDELDKTIFIWNKLQAGSRLEKMEFNTPAIDSTYTSTATNLYSETEDTDRFRGLAKSITINKIPYLLTIETNVEETEETVVVIAMVSLLFFFILVIGFLAINRWLSTKIWSPFNNTLTKLKSFKLSQETNIDFEKSSTIEFEELNEVLNKLIDQNISIYKTQKEFTENASHELQTPLAIIKNKLDLLVQKEPLTDRQYNIVEEVNVALSRISRINKNLLLLAKIENNQFEAREEVNISELVANALEFVKELRVDKNIVIHTAMEENVTVIGNRVLTEIMINNLLFNAFTHNTLNGELSIELKKGLLLISNSGVQALDEGDLYARFKKNSHNNKGNGLGLAIIYEICKKQKSSIEYTFSDHLHHFKISFKI